MGWSLGLISTELECFMSEIGIKEDSPKKPDIVWPEVKEDLTKISKGWKPSYAGEEPPF